MKVDTSLKFSVNICLLFLFVCTSVSFSATTKENFNPTGSDELFPDKADGRKTEMPTLQAHPLGQSKIKVDGKLDDPVWEEAEATKGFVSGIPIAVNVLQLCWRLGYMTIN
ncbi:MAG: hypothetical protein HN356_14085 [Calditrichaeota bacterium]|jgi:hypothetical protein|nr:hypothetical protein [Calditrichota bacterium]MBT7788756.1 hypothetical protein [Calditrichota bacterium]